MDVSDCPSKKYHCKKAEGACKSVGVCTPKPGTCKDSEADAATVCGCDAKTYKSVCYASQAGMNVYKKGSCK